MISNIEFKQILKDQLMKLDKQILSTHQLEITFFRNLILIFLMLPLVLCAAETAPPKERLEALRSLNSSAVTPRKAFEAAVVGLDLSDELIKQKYFSDAAKAASVSKAAAKKANNAYLQKSSIYYSKYALGLDVDYRSVEKSLNALKSDPKNKEAALEVGLFYCLHNWDWKKGLPLLKRCSDMSLMSLADLEQQVPSAAADQIKLGDLWAGYAKEGDPKLKTALMQRAKYWYLKAVPQLSTLEQRSLVRRINRIPKKTFQLNIAVRIDGSDTLTLSEDQLTWRNHSFKYPSILVMNGIKWETKQSTVLANQGGTRILPHHIHLTSVRLKKQRGRGPVTLKIEQDQIHITFDDRTPAGSNDYVIILSFDTF